MNIIAQDILIIVLYLGLVFQFIIILYSLIYTFYLIQLTKKDRQALATKAENEGKIRSARNSYTKNKIIITILLFEVIYRVLGVVDYIHILRKQHTNPRTEYQLTANCSLKGGSDLALYYNWGIGYRVLVGANYASLVFPLSLICVLSLYTINTFKDHNKLKNPKISFYLVFSIIKCCLIPILFTFPPLYLPVKETFIGILIADYILLLVLTRKLFHKLKRRCIDIKYHGSEEELNTLNSFEENVKTYRNFSLLLLIGLGMQVLGEFAQNTLTIVGSLLQNACFFEVQYNIKIGLNLTSRHLEIIEIVTTLVEFVSRNIFNITLIIAYSVYSYKHYVKMNKRVRVYRYQLVREPDSFVESPLLLDY